MASFDLSFEYDSPDEIRALYQGLLRAAAEERTERDRIGRLRGSGYLAADSNQIEYEHAAKRADILGFVAYEVEQQMQSDDIEPW